jgi:hypothetical protein
MSPAVALAMIRRAAATHQLRIVTHARERMVQRGMRLADVEHACLSALDATLQDNERWRLDGKDLDGDPLTVIATIQADVIVVTVF